MTDRLKIKKFKDIVAWQKPKKLTIVIYGLFKDNPDYSFKNQIQRASVSIMNNIAEGFERISGAEFKRFLFIANGSCGGARSMLNLTFDLDHISKDECNDLTKKSIEISKMISGFIKSLKLFDFMAL